MMDDQSTSPLVDLEHLDFETRNGQQGARQYLIPTLEWLRVLVDYLPIQAVGGTSGVKFSVVQCNSIVPTVGFAQIQNVSAINLAAAKVVFYIG